MRSTLIVIVVVLFSVSAGYYYNETKRERTEESPNLTASNKKDISQSGDKFPSSGNDLSDKKEPTGNGQVVVERTSLPHWKEAFSNYEVPEKNLADEVDEILESINNDSSGEPELKLFRISDYCDRAAKNEQELQELRALHEESSLLSGQSNGETLENINRAVTHYNECKSLENKGLLETYDYLEVSAEKGHPKAKTVLATLYEPNDFSSWPENEREKYREKMKKNLDEARENCEPQAFYSFAYGVGEDTLWVDRGDIPEDVRKYSNLIARGMIYANKTEGAEQYLASRKNELKSIASNMTEHEVTEAEKYGRYLYDQSCK